MFLLPPPIFEIINGNFEMRVLLKKWSMGTALRLTLRFFFSAFFIFDVSCFFFSIQVDRYNDEGEPFGEGVFYMIFLEGVILYEQTDSGKSRCTLRIFLRISTVHSLPP